MSIKFTNSSVVKSTQQRKGPGYPNDEYLSQVNEWKRNRAVIQGPSYTKDFDTIPSSNNLLLPFNPTMTQSQYDFYKAEAEVPGVTSEFSKMIIGGLLRKQPLLEIDNAPKEAKDWILNDVGGDKSNLLSFLSGALWEEMQTSRAWIQIDYPMVDLESLTPEDRREVKPYPILHTAENIVNWSVSTSIKGVVNLDTLITRYFTSEYDSNSPYHPKYVDTVQVHQLNEEGLYIIETFIRNTSDTPSYIDGGIDYNFSQLTDEWSSQGVYTNLFKNGERMDFIPFFPLNGSVDTVDPMMTPIVNREIALYNKISRRNHLLYLSATYTPVVKSDSLTESEKNDLVKQGLGTWMFVNKDDTVETLQTPTDALKDMEEAIKNGYDELTRIGVKMLSLEPNNSDQSGVALSLRNASQNAALATLNAKVSESMKKIIKHLVNWRYDLDIKENDIRFNLSGDFNPAPRGADWMRLITEWYSGGLIPRSAFIELAKNNDALPTDYDDIGGKDEISQDDRIISPREQYESELASLEKNNDEADDDEQTN
tara:strand:- start:2334 stop:3950 length:1617 start_codon:yes stop_codon:yes gene_type:complete